VAGCGQALPNAGELTEKIANGNLATKALPTAEEKLKTSASAVTRLRAKVVEAAKRQLVTEASIAIADYDAAAAALCVLYDRLVGIKGALVGEAGHQTLDIPMFRMTPGAEVAILRHGALDGVGEPRRSTLKATSDWTRALDRLLENPTADLTDLIGM
jgi:hypothetical protein